MTIEVSHLQSLLIFDKNTIRNQLLMHYIPLMDIVQPHSNLQQTVKDSFRVKILIFIREKSLL